MSLFVLAAAVACVARTVTQEEVFKEFREWCVRHSQEHPKLAVRKLCYLFTCEYCFSHWVAAAALVLTGWRLHPWGFVITTLVIVAVANVYLRLFQLLTLVVILVRARGKWTQPLSWRDR